jgi:nucleoside-triphosphatase THEP1
MDNFCGNGSKYIEISQWIQGALLRTSHKLSFCDLLFVAGNSGVGKTYSVQKICENLDLFVVNITTTNCSSSLQLTDILTKSITSSMIQVLTNNTKQKVIVIDEFESMMTIDRTINTALYNILNMQKFKTVPIICIISSDMVKRIGPIKKKCKIVDIEDPSDNDIIQFLKQHYPDKSDDIIRNVCKNSKGNVSQCIKKLNNEQSIDDNMDQNLQIELLYSRGFNRENISKLLYTDPWLMPLKYHENLIKELQNRKITVQKSREHYKAFMNDIVYFDYLMCNNATDIGIEYFASVTSRLAEFPIKKNAVSKIDDFTKMLSYLSLQKKNIKKAYSSDHPTIIVGRNNMFLN